MRLEVVDVFCYTADNTIISDTARLMISMLSEQLRSCHSLKKVWRPKQRNALGTQMSCLEYSIISRKQTELTERFRILRPTSKRIR